MNEPIKSFSLNTANPRAMDTGAILDELSDLEQRLISCDAHFQEKSKRAEVDGSSKTLEHCDWIQKNRAFAAMLRKRMTPLNYELKQRQPDLSMRVVELEKRVQRIEAILAPMYGKPPEKG